MQHRPFSNNTPDSVGFQIAARWENLALIRSAASPWESAHVRVELNRKSNAVRHTRVLHRGYTRWRDVFFDGYPLSSCMQF